MEINTENNEVFNPTYGSKCCSFCHKNMISGEKFVYCPECGAPHHKECWEINSRCASCGYPNKEQLNNNISNNNLQNEYQNNTQIPPANNVPNFYPIGNGYKYCSHCGKVIPENAVVCIFCGCQASNIQIVQTNGPGKDEPANVGLVVLSVFINIVGIILGIVSLTDGKKRAGKAYLLAALIPWAAFFAFIVFLAIVGRIIA